MPRGWRGGGGLRSVALCAGASDGDALAPAHPSSGLSDEASRLRAASTHHVLGGATTGTGTDGTTMVAYEAGADHRGRTAPASCAGNAEVGDVGREGDGRSLSFVLSTAPSFSPLSVSLSPPSVAALEMGDSAGRGAGENEVAEGAGTGGAGAGGGLRGERGASFDSLRLYSSLDRSDWERHQVAFYS